MSTSRLVSVARYFGSSCFGTNTDAKQHNGRSVVTRPRPSRFVWICRLRYRSLLMRIKQQSRHWRWSRNGVPADGKPKRALIVLSNNWFSRMCGTRLAMLLWETSRWSWHRTQVVLTWWAVYYPAMASATAGSSASEGLGSFHLSHPTSILIPLGSLLSVFCFWLFVWGVLCFVCFLFCFLLVFLFSLGHPGFREVSFSSNLI